MSTPRDSLRALAGTWTHAGGRWCARLLLLGGVWPFLLTVFLFDTQIRVWPWDFFFAGDAPAERMVPREGALRMLALLPFVAVAAVSLICRVRHVVARAVLFVAVGAGTLLTLATLEFSDAVVLLGAPFLLTEVRARLLLLAVLACAVAIVVGNRLRKIYWRAKLPRLLTAFGGFVFVALFCLPLVDGKSVLLELFDAAAWRPGTWPLAVAVLVLFGFGVLGALGAFFRRRHEGIAAGTSVVARLLLIVAPLAIVLARVGDGDSARVLVWDGGPWPAVMAFVKCCLIAYGGIFLLAIGMASALCFLLARGLADEPAAATGSAAAAAALSQ